MYNNRQLAEANPKGNSVADDRKVNGYPFSCAISKFCGRPQRLRGRVLPGAEGGPEDSMVTSWVRGFCACAPDADQGINSLTSFNRKRAPIGVLFLLKVNTNYSSAARASTSWGRVAQLVAKRTTVRPSPRGSHTS